MSVMKPLAEQSRLRSKAAVGVVIAAFVSVAAVQQSGGRFLATAQDQGGTGAASGRPSATDLFAVFRSAARGPANAAPEKTSQARLARIDAAVRPDAGVDPTKTRLSESDADHDTYLLAGEETVCAVIVESNGASSSGCALLKDAADPDRPPVDVTDVGDGVYRVTVLARDEITGIVLLGSNGAPRSIAITRNVASTVTRGAPRGITWHRPDGTVGALYF